MGRHKLNIISRGDYKLSNISPGNKNLIWEGYMFQQSSPLLNNPCGWPHCLQVINKNSLGRILIELKCWLNQLVTKKWVFDLETSVLTTFTKRCKIHAFYDILVHFDEVLEFFMFFYTVQFCSFWTFIYPPLSSSNLLGN